MDYLFTGISLLFSTLLGFLVLQLIDVNKKLGFLESIALSYGIGLGLIAIEMTILALAGIGFTTQNILVPLTIIILLLYFIFHKGSLKIQFKLERFKTLELFFLGGIAFEVFYAFFRCLIKPMESWDAVANWALKAKAIYFFRGLPLDIFRQPCPADLVSTSDYPWLLPFSEAYIYTFLRHFNDFCSKAIIPLFFLACLVIFYFLLKRLHLNRLHSLIFTFMLSSIPQFNAYATISYADLIMGFYYSVSFLYLCFWFRERDLSFLLISMIFTALVGYTKTEGLLLGVINILVFLTFMLFNKIIDKKKTLKKFIIYGSTIILLLLPLFILKNLTSVGFPTNSESENSNIVPYHTINVEVLANFKLENFTRIPFIIYNYQKQFFGIKRWNIIWILFFSIILFKFRDLFKEDLKYITMAILLIFLAYTSVYIVSPGIEGDIRTVSRLFLHFLPIVVFFLARILIHDKKGKEGRLV